MKKCITKILVAGGLACAAPISANATLYNSLSSFTQVVPQQVPPVAADRSVLGNMFDGDLTTMYSLGLGGNIQFEVDASTGSITSGTFAELTYLGGSDQEAVMVYLGNNLGSYVYIGNLLNRNYPGGPGAVNASPSIATLTYSAAGQNTLYNLTVGSGTYDSLKLVDISNAPSSQDGFDIAELSVTTAGTAVAEPASLFLLGSGVFAVVYLRHRQRRERLTAPEAHGASAPSSSDRWRPSIS